MMRSKRKDLLSSILETTQPIFHKSTKIISNRLLKAGFNKFNIMFEN